MVDIDQEMDQGIEEQAPPPAVSPLVKLIKSLTGGGKAKVKAPPAPAPAVPSVGVSKGKSAAPADGSSQKDAAALMPSGPLVSIVTRNEFYRDGFRSLLRIAIVQGLVIVGLLAALVSYITTSHSVDRYFATTADGRIMKLVPLDQQNMTTAALLSWVAQASSEIMTFGFHDYQRRLQQSSRHFTHHGWETFTAALNRSQIIEGMQSGQQVLTASPRSAPILQQEGVLNGKYRWKVKLPLQVSFRSAGDSKNNRTQNLNVILTIDRVPSLENPNGVGIEQWISTEG